MKIEIKRVTDWQRVVDAARFTQGKEPLGHEPSDEFKKQMILSEHSPLRELEFDIKMYGIPYWVSNHFVRHVHAQPFVSTSRPDITGSKVSRHDMRQDDLVNLQLSLNAQEIINISKLRLCSKAARETREWCLTSWFILSLTLHSLAFLSVYTEDSALSRSHVEEVLILHLKESEKSIKNSISKCR